MPTDSSSAEQITRASKSNLALAFVSLGAERRRDITAFYAFCRLIDDIADATDVATGEKAHRLTVWRTALHGPVPGESPVAPAVRGLLGKYAITPAMLEEIIDGVESTVTGSRARLGLSVSRFSVTEIRPARITRSSSGWPCK